MKWTRRILIAVIILAGLITAVWWEENWRGQKIWEESCARLRAAGEPVDIADIIPPIIPDEENVAAAPIFAELLAASDPNTTRLGLITEGWATRVSRSGVRFPTHRPLSPGNLSFLDLWADSMRKTFPASPPTGPFQSTSDEVLHFYAQFDGEWNEIHDALNRPQCRWPLEYKDGLEMKVSYLSCLQQLPVTSRGWIAALAASGHEDAYTKSLVSLLELGHRVEQSPANLLSYLVGITMSAVTLQAWQNSLPLANLSDEQLLSLQLALQKFALRNALVAVQNERVMFLHTYIPASSSYLYKALTGSCSCGTPSRWPDAPRWVNRVEDTAFHALFIARPRGWELADLASFQESLVDLSSGILDSKRDVFVASKVGDMRTEALVLADKSGWFTFSRHALEETASMHQRILQRAASFHATVRCAMVWCAAERFRLKYGHFPQAQEQLVPEFLSAPLLDPIDGRPLRYSLKDGNRLLVYSLGWDGKDDAGVRGKRTEGDFGWSSDPAMFSTAEDLERWKQEDEERAERLAPSKSAPGRPKPKKSKRGTAP
ncbi:hypothetical protein [Roseimicrobium sp. ORNL1]|uniref:hypothetical protein n=1 Tax=Roseimicrobium sp. ORNL1 TaxID=2711231 RepID=UPI0013E18A22|nr:hypothetical protein [Roseimicrobium sp. ORNL1]QIF05437.1 hypothetical protein G5S37_29340 [Roseimicrobium sp. ORNL1]